MEVKVIGYRRISFKAENGDMVNGYRVFYTYGGLTNLEGLACANVFVSDAKLLELFDGAIVCDFTYHFFYNQYGNLIKAIAD